MKVFLSWSGELSHRVACVLRDWLPSVIQSLHPYVSSEDIDKGTRWSTDIARELEESTYGILCLTRSNVLAPWINFEAGALSKTIDKASVTPFLFKMKRSELQGPLLQFQSVIYDKDDLLKMIASINNKLSPAERLDDIPLKRSFAVWWPELEAALDPLDDMPTRIEESKQGVPDAPAILEELLELARTQQKLLRSPEELLPPRYLQLAIESARRPVMRQRGELQSLHKAVVEALQKAESLPHDAAPEVRELQHLLEQIHHRIHEVEAVGNEHRQHHTSPSLKLPKPEP